jgi:O-antigen/teichoic acid export membrane protein
MGPEIDGAKLVPLWKKHFWLNTASGAIRTVTRLILGLFLFRLLFSSLSTQAFGFWSLLWSLFGYGILLDFGFGFTAQKAVAEKSATGDWQDLSRLLSTLLWTFVGLSIILALFFFLIRGFFLSAVGLPDTAGTEYYLSYLIFFGGLALTFPFGLFPEVLQGLQRLDLSNWLRTGAVVLNFIGIVVAIKLGASFPVIVFVSVATTLLPLVGAMFVVFRMLPEVSLSIRNFDFRAIRSQLGFSMAAYLITFSNVLMAKSDQAVLGFTLGVGVITYYQAGYKVSEMLNLFVVQLQEALSPAAANLNALGDNQGLRDLLLRTSRLTVLFVVPLYGLSAVYLEPLIKLLTGLDEVAHDVIMVGHILLLAVFSSQLTNSCTKRILMMCGYEKKLLYVSLVEAGANFVISVCLALTIGMVGVAIGSLVPTVLVGWLWVLPMALKYTDLKLFAYVQYLFSESTPLILFAVCLGLTLFFLPMPEEGGFLNLCLRGSLSAGPAMAVILYRIKRVM